MVTFIAVHLIAGILLGTAFRFGVMLPVLVIVTLESVFGAQWLGFAPWYVLLISGFVAAQVGFSVAALVRRARRREQATEGISAPVTPPGKNHLDLSSSL